MDQLPLQMAIAYFGLMIAAWAGLCLYLRATHQRRVEETVVQVTERPEPAVAQAA